MALPKGASKHEVSFRADVKSWADALCKAHSEWPFSGVEIETPSGPTRKWQDMRILSRQDGSPIITGESKMPGTREGRTPYDPELVRGAQNKAEDVGARYFFTWNVNTLVLFDRSQWDHGLLDRRVRQWELGLGLTAAEQCDHPEVKAHIRDEFLPRLFADLALIVEGEFGDWGMPPDEIFIRSLESHLDWPIVGTRDYLAEAALADAGFAGRLQAWMTEEMQWTFDPEDPENWRQTLDRAARTLCYVFSNRAIFYGAVRTRYLDELSALKMPRTGSDPERVYAHFLKRFGDAVRLTGDYEPIFYPEVGDWAGSLVFASARACTGWQGLLHNLGEYDFRKIPHDVVGAVFQRLIAPEERRRFGQFFTHEDIVDVVNSFCIRSPDDSVLDPACGSGSFLVRAYQRKAWLSDVEGTEKGHEDLLREIFGCDIALFPAHLATLNLAARQILDIDNYPLIRRGNFFEAVEQPAKFCTVPGEDGKKTPVPLPMLDAIVGNPPYLRQEEIAKLKDIKKRKGESKVSFESRRKNTKEHFQRLASADWPGLKLDGRSDLHVYFWPVATSRLTEEGYFGFLTSSSWLDVGYGFPLQGWVLENFRLVAVIESVDEPWFEDARVKTSVTILQRCTDAERRKANVTKFVRLEKPVAEILGDRSEGGEARKQSAADALRDLVESTTERHVGDGFRIIPVPQQELWHEGVEAASILAETPATDEDDEVDGKELDTGELLAGGDGVPYGRYVAGKWGRFLRAPDIYFRLMHEHGDRFARLGRIADVKRGITSGCDAFFMPRDVTDRVLRDVSKGMLWKDVNLMHGCPRKEIESGKVRIVRAGNGSLHPVEAKYLRPEVHSLMDVQRPVFRLRETDRVVLWVDARLGDLKDTHVSRYIQWGARQTFASSKSKAVSVPLRSTCASRPVWYGLTGTAHGSAFWPMAQQYRHIIPANPDALVCNHNLFYIAPIGLTQLEERALPAVLNSTLLALFKTYYGRYAGTEGNLKTEVVDVKLMDVPDVRGITDGVASRLMAAFDSIQSRDSGRFVEGEFMDCHTVERARALAGKPITLPDELQHDDRRQLDDAVLELIGVADKREREGLLDELYFETARHYRQIRIMEIQKQVQRAGGAARRLGAVDLAAGLWDVLDDAERGVPLQEWMALRTDDKTALTIPEGRAEVPGTSNMFYASDVVFVRGKDRTHLKCSGPEQAALVAELANLGFGQEVEVPTDGRACDEWRTAIRQRLASARERFAELAAQRTGEEGLQEEITHLLLHWHTRGRR